MKLQQLRYIVEVVKHDLNVSQTAENLYTSQPGISKQIKLLEDELGVQIFARSGKHLTHLTPIGQDIVHIAQEILNKVSAIKVAAMEYTQPNQGVFNIATTYTQARYMLPLVIQQFMQKYPHISLQMEQGSSRQVIEDVVSGKADFAIVSELPKVTDDFIVLPCYHWNYAIILPKNHPLAKLPVLTIADLAQHPLVSYDFSGDGSDLSNAFTRANYEPNIVFNISDADLIKTYVKLGIGVGILAKMAVDEVQDADLVVFNAGHLFSYNTTYIVFNRTLFLRNYMYEFIYQFSSHLTKELVDKALSCHSNTEILAMFNGIKLPVR